MWKNFDRSLNLKADVVLSRNHDGGTAAVGAKPDLSRHIMLETWANFPERNRVNVITKTHFVFRV